MVTNCCVCGVEKGSMQDSNFIFHSFPKNEDLKLKWYEAIGKKVYQSAHICSKHFKPEDYKNYDDHNLRRIMLKSSAVPSLQIKLSENSEPVNSSCDTEYISTENRNDENIILLEENSIIQSGSCDDRLQVDKSNMSISIDNSTNKKSLNNEATLHSIASQIKKRKIINNTLKSLKKHRYQNNILGIMRSDEFINENAWLRFQKCINKIKKQCKLLTQRNRKLFHEINGFKELLKKQLSDDTVEIQK